MANDEIDFNEIEEEQEEALSPNDFKASGFIKNPEVGMEIEFTVQKIVNNKNTKGKNSVSGAEFDIGLKSKDGKVKRYDIHTEQGIYTIPNWSIFFALLGKPTSLLQVYAKNHNNSYAGAKVSIKKLLDGSHASMKIKDLAKVLGKSEEETAKYQESIKQAIKEQKLYTIKVE